MKRIGDYSMKKVLALIVILALVFSLTASVAAVEVYDEDRPTFDAEAPAVVFDAEAFRLEDDGAVFVRLRQFAYLFDATVEWDGGTRTALITPKGGAVPLPIAVEQNGGFIEGGVSWIPISMASWLQQMLHVTPVVERIDLTLWERERFADVRDPSFSTDLPHGEIAVNYIEYMSDNLGARSAFTYAELEAAVWIVEELLAMGHDWDNISVQEFTYWDVNALGVGLFGSLHWANVTSPHILGVGRDYQLRPDRVSQNVVLTIPGESDSKIIVGAHYDSPPYPSASDNASGTALLLESAQRMLELDNYHTIVYVFFGAEEVGLIGAYYYLEMLSQEERDNIVMMVNADVLIEGPYIIYGAGSQPQFYENIEFTEEFMDALTEAMIETILAQAEELIEFMEELGNVINDHEEFINNMIEENLAAIPNMPDGTLFAIAIQLGLIEPPTNYVALEVSEIAAALTAQHEFEIISLPEAISFPSDNLVFLFSGYTVVNFVGLERVENITEELEAMIQRFMQLTEEFMGTLLHSPHDEFNIIESIWPGMMLNNLRAFGLFLEEILTTNFS
jgi:hypothetical protein